MVDRSEARRIQDEVRRVLVEHWDPIRISDQEACWDEYDSYIGGAVKLLFENESGENRQVSWRITWEQMGPTPNEKAIASTVSALRQIRLT
jgi:hypothetical protein